MLEDSLPRISFAKPWNSETSVYTQSTTWLLSNMQSINCFIIVDKVLLCLTIKKFDVFDSGWYDCSKQNSASVQSICNWHCTKYCGTVSKDWRGDKLLAALVFTSSKIPRVQVHMGLNHISCHFQNEKIYIFLLCIYFKTVLLHHPQIYDPGKCF